MIIVNRRIFRRNYVGLTLWPLIFVKEAHLKNDKVLLNHEKIHLRQQREMLVIPFYVLYLCEWLVRSCFYMDCYRAYRNISFEQEAYKNEANLKYLAGRTRFSFARYL